MIYLDYASTTPISDEVLDVYVKASKRFFGNPSSLHDVGSEANELLKVCRQVFAKMINGEEEGVYYTSSGSEANILAIRSLIDGNRKSGNHLITVGVEHSSIYNLFKQLESEGYSVTYLSTNSNGEIDINELKTAINEHTILASIHHGNFEIGTIQDLKQIGELLAEHDVIFHTDCVQTFGKVPIDAKGYNIDSLTVASHKIYGPKGVGIAYISPKTPWKSQQKGTTHENGFKPGTVNVPSILAFTSAAQLVGKDMEKSGNKFQKLREGFLQKISEIDHDITVYGSNHHQLPSIIGVTISGIQGQYVMLECNRRGIAISTGSACQVGQQAPSRTMQAIGRSAEEAKQFIRISLGKNTTTEDIDKLVEAFRQIVAK